MILLAFDTATACCSAAVWHDGRILAVREDAMERGHAEALAPMIEDVMREAGIAFAALDGIAVTVGPGAFTGLRIGLSMARGIALAAAIPCLGVTTLEAVAAGVDPAARAGRDVLVTLDAKRSDVYAQRFGADLTPRGKPRAVVPECLAGDNPERSPIVLAGDAADIVFPVLKKAGIDVARSDSRAPKAAIVAAIAAARHEAGIAAVPPHPLYLRAPDVTLPRDSVTGKKSND